MTPMPLSRADTLSDLDRPERSRNAKAQARHRAKRKAYIEQLESTVTKLQVALALSPEQVAALPAPVIRIRELEEENDILHREVDDLRRQLEERNARLRPDIGGRRHGAVPPSPYERGEYEPRRRRLAESQSHAYLQNPSAAHTHAHAHSPPPPLLIPPPQHAAYPRAASSALPPYGMYQMPGTPSASSASTSASSGSPFSPCDYTPPSTLQSQSQTRPHSSAAAAAQSLLAYGQAPGQYEYVKVEEDSYHGHAVSHANGYSATLPAFAGGHSSLNHWQTYSAQRS